MTPVSGIIIPVLTYAGTPPSNFGQNGQYCIDGTNHIIYGPKTSGSWGTGFELGGADIPDGTAAGQMLYWDGSGWTNGTNIIYDETNARLNINAYPTPSGRLAILGDTGTASSLTKTVAEFRLNNSVSPSSPVFSIVQGISTAAVARYSIIKNLSGFLCVDPGVNYLSIGSTPVDNSKTLKIGTITAADNASPSIGQPLALSGGLGSQTTYNGGDIKIDGGGHGGSASNGKILIGSVRSTYTGIGTAAPTEKITIKGNQNFTGQSSTTERQIAKIVPSMPVTTDSAFTGQYDIYVSDYNATSGRKAVSIIADGTGTDTRIGDPEGGNYTQIESDGTVEFIGNATVWEDLNFDPDSGGGPAATLPDHVTINNVVHREFTSANNQLCGSVKEIPHNAKISGTVTYYPHLHMFLKSGESAGTTGVTFTIYWELRVSDGTTSGSVALTATSTELTNNSHKFTVNDETGFTGSDELGAQLALTLKRTGGDAGDVIVTTYGIHYEMDTCGSRQKLAK